MNDRLERRLLRLEWRLNALIAIGILNVVLLAVRVMQDLLPTTVTVVLFLALLVALAIIFRRRIPGWIAAASQSIFSTLDTNDQKFPD